MACVSRPSEAPYTGGGEPGRAAANDDQVAQGRRRAPGSDPQHLGHRRVGRVAQYVIAPDDDRRLGGLHPEVPQHELGFFVALQILELVGHAIACEELPQTQRVARVTGSDESNAAPDLDQDRAARQERAQDDVGEVLVVAQQPEEFGHGDADDLARVADDRASDTRARQ